MLLPSPISTFPIRVALGETYASTLTFGFFPRNSINVMLNHQVLRREIALTVEDVFLSISPMNERAIASP
jgi:hypothetical protein